MMKPKILFVNGIRDDRVVEIMTIKDDGRITHKASGTCDFYNYLETDLIQKHLLLLDTNKDSPIKLPQNLSVIVNQISEPDTHKISLYKMHMLSKMKQGQLPLINPPHLVMQTTREKIAQKLSDLPGVIMPQTIRIKPKSPQDILAAIAEAEMPYPLMIRECGAHGGKTTLLMPDAASIQNLFSIAMDGRDYYLTEYVDYSRQGLYRVYRIVVIDGVAHLRHKRTLDQWLVHHKRCKDYMEKHPEILAKETKLLEHFEQDLKPQIQPLITEIYQRVKLDYFGIDCDIQPDGRLLIFEVNANMLILKDLDKPSARYDKTLAAIKKAVVSMLLKRATESVPVF